MLFHCSAFHQSTTAWRSFPSSKTLLCVGKSKIIPTCNCATKTPKKKSQIHALRDVRKRCYCDKYCSKNNNEEMNAVGRGRKVFVLFFNTLLYTKHALKCAFVKLQQHLFLKSDLVIRCAAPKERKKDLEKVVFNCSEKNTNATRGRSATDHRPVNWGEEGASVPSCKRGGRRGGECE